MTTTETLTGERADLLEALQERRWFLKFTAQGLTDEQARLSPTASELTIGGLIKHVTQVEKNWVKFIEHGPSAQQPTAEAMQEHLEHFTMREDETLAGLIAAYDEVAAYTDALLAHVDLDLAHPLPEAPWFPPGKKWTARRVYTQLIGETAQHSGHADILRETIDGQKTMG